MDYLRITEIFFSLQGESRTVGWPTVFVRLTGCPLRCQYCDTAYAFTGGERLLLADILDRVAQYGAHYVCVTGGEPLAQLNCLLLLDALVEKGYKVSLETSGALDVSRVNPKVTKVIDLKTPGSKEVAKNCYANLTLLVPNDQVKFVVTDEADYEWAKAMLHTHRLTERCEVLFSPAAGSQHPTELAEKILHDRLAVRFQLPLHRVLWGDRRGV